jgi:dTDP-4-amino-4,6-dideoxygalactose transaminase
MIPVTKSELPPLDKYVNFLRKIWDSSWLTNDGEFVQLLGRRLEEYLKVKELVLMSNGTLALQIALRALGIKGEVITTPFTFAATTNVLLWEGLTPVFADINPETFNLDPVDVERKITEKTSAVLAVHVYGNPCYVSQLESICNRHNLRLIFDAAHAFGVEYGGKSIAAFGDVSTLSFHATKVFNTIEGGAVVTRNPEIAEKLKLMRNHGIRSEFEVVLPGTNAKMNEFQAAMGLCNLDSVDEAISARKTLYDRYIEGLSILPGVSFQKVIASKYNYSYMPVLLGSKEERDSAYSFLIKGGVKPRKYFFPLTANFNYFKGSSIKFADLLNANDVASKILCLPLYPCLDVSSVDYICSIIKDNHDSVRVMLSTEPV